MKLVEYTRTSPLYKGREVNMPSIPQINHQCTTACFSHVGLITYEQCTGMVL